MLSHPWGLLSAKERGPGPLRPALSLQAGAAALGATLGQIGCRNSQPQVFAQYTEWGRSGFTLTWKTMQ